VPVWYDGEIAPGDSWRKEIFHAMASCKVAVLMVSPELPRVVVHHGCRTPLPDRRCQKGELKLTWMMLRKCIMHELPLREFQALHNTGGSPQFPVAAGS